MARHGAIVAPGINQNYYETIQCADIDGDRQFELIGRAPDNDPNGGGLQIWKFVPGSGYPNNPVGQWVQMSNLGAWTDANGWNKVQYYQTIQTAIIKTPAPNIFRPQSAILGRGPLGMQTWYYNPHTKRWQQTSQPYPPFTASQQAAYVQLDTQLRGGQANGQIRSVYSDETADFSVWMQRMYSPPPARYDTPPDQRPSTILPLPVNNPPTQQDWNIVVWQIYWEMSYIGTPGSSLNDYYGNKVSGLIKTAYQGQNFTLFTVGEQLGISDGSGANVALSLLALLAEAAAAVAGFPELDIASAAAISGLLATAFSAASEFLPNSGAGFQQAYSNLQATLSNGFGQTLNANANNQFAITGGTDGANNYVPGDWGLISVLGPLIQNGVWKWPGSTNGVVSVLQRSYAITLCQALIPTLSWYAYYDSTSAAPTDFPSQYMYLRNGGGQGNQFWISTNSFSWGAYPPTGSLSLLFDAAVPGQWNPLGVPLQNVYLGGNGWPLLQQVNRNDPSFVRPTPQTNPGVDIRTSVQLTRDSVTGEMIAAVTLHNRGWTGAANVEITGAQLRNPALRGSLPTRHTHIAHGRTKTLHLRFPDVPAGQIVLLRLSGRYLGGTFGGSLRIKIP